MSAGRLIDQPVDFIIGKLRAKLGTGCAAVRSPMISSRVVSVCMGVIRSMPPLAAQSDVRADETSWKVISTETQLGPTCRR
jgi:hypothetical protein